MEDELHQYWKNYYEDEKQVLRGYGHENVSRTRNGIVVNPEIWDRTLDHIANIIHLEQNDAILELCCGNGMILGELAEKCGRLVGVDYSRALLNQFRENYSSDKIELINYDVNTWDFDSNQFNAIIIYFSIQHFDEKETFLLLERCINHLLPKGRILIGDIPDFDKKWSYINKPEFHRDYFQRLKNNSPMIGHWFKKEFFLAMNSCFPNTKFTIIDQPEYQINSDYRFDLLIEKV